MVPELVTGLGIFKTLFDTAKGLKDMSDATVRNRVGIELQEKILTAQAQQAALVERISDLEKEVTRFETWDAEKQRYDLQEIAAGVFARVLKPDAQPSEPSHKACPNCYADRRISVLQQETRFPGRKVVLTCHHCGLDLHLVGGTDPAPTKVIRGGRVEQIKRP